MAAKLHINHKALFITIFASLVLFLAAFWRLDIDTDVINSLPHGDEVISDGLFVFNNHPFMDQVVINISADKHNPTVLIECAEVMKKEMHKSGLFSRVGMGDMASLFPELSNSVVNRLPLLFSSDMLAEEVAPLLQPQELKEHLSGLQQSLYGMESLGQAKFIASDPLSLKNIILSRMQGVLPSEKSIIFKNHIFSSDKNNLLLSASLAASSTDTASARQLKNLLDRITAELVNIYDKQGIRVTITSLGSFRASLDNEDIIRHDVNLAIMLSTIGIVALLMISFSRPWLGVFALLPALSGISAALFVYSLYNNSLSIMVLGFGAAVIGITVDQGIGYLLFLDRAKSGTGHGVSREFRFIGSMAAFSTIGAFLLLAASGFPMFVELGQFTALGILFSYLFVHYVFPLIFPRVDSGRQKQGLLYRCINRISQPSGFVLWLFGLFFLFMLFFARPVFEVSMESMNNVSAETIRAEEIIREVWGEMGDDLVIMHKGADTYELQKKNDTLAFMLQQDEDKQYVHGSVVSAQLFPGEELARSNLAAWHEFWDLARRKEVKRLLSEQTLELGFAPHAFNSFLKTIEPDYTLSTTIIDEKLFPLLGIVELADNRGVAQFVNLERGGKFVAADFFARYHNQGYHIFISDFFSQKLGELLFSTFSRIFILLACALLLFLFIFYLDVKLVLITTAPLIFAYVATLGSLNIMGRPLDIPALMLSVVIFGMGVDYAIFMVRAYQRYRSYNHPSFVLVRMTLLLAAFSTMIGFGVLCLADHAMLKSMGIVSLLAITYSLLGAFFILPSLLNKYFSASEADKPADRQQRVSRRYRLLEPFPRVFTRIKLLSDPMFKDLPARLSYCLKDKTEVKTIVDIGCGYGVPGSWCLEHFPYASVFGLDPDEERVRVANLAWGKRGRAEVGLAPDIPDVKEVDIGLVLDMLHYLDDNCVNELFARISKSLVSGGILVIRVTVDSGSPHSLAWKFEEVRMKMCGYQGYFRDTEIIVRWLAEVGLITVENEVSASNKELAWIVARKK